MIKVNNLNKYYHKGKDNEIHVINNTNIVLPDSGFVVFLGASGSGKTTLINVIAGLDKAKGEITYDDVTFKNYKMNKIDKFRRENIGYVFQNYNLLPNASVYENLRLVLELMNITNKEEVDERIDYVLDMLGMKKYKNKLASNLSGGQMQRVSIARALVKDSKIIIADEPTGNLDSENTIEVMNILKSISKDRLVIMVTHDRKNAEFYADRIVSIKDGVIESDVEAEEIESLENTDKSKIYLKDLDNKVLELGNVKINLFVEKDEELKDLELTIVKKDGQIYLKNDEIKYLDKDSKIKLINDNYRDIKKEDIKAFNYNPKPFTKEKKKASLRPFFRGLANAYRSHTSSSRKMKGLHACFVIIGVVMAVCVMMLSVGTYVKGNQIDYSDTGLELKRFDYESFESTLDRLINDGTIIDSSSQGSIYLNLGNDNVSLTNSMTRLHYSLINDRAIEGVTTLASDDEIIITKRLADGFIKKCANIEKLTYKSLIGMECGGRKIVGIVDSEATNYYCYYYNYEYGYRDLNPYMKYNYSGTVTMEYYENLDYTLVGGTGFNSDPEVAKTECLVSLDSYLETYGTKTKVDDFTIVGVFDTGNNRHPDILLYDEEYVRNNYNVYEAILGRLLAFVDIPSNNCELASGVMPKAIDEILVSDLYDETTYTTTAQYIKDHNLKIVGRFKCKYNILSNLIAYSKEGSIKRQFALDNVLITNDDQKAISEFKKCGATYMTSYNYQHDLRVKQKRQMFGSTISVSVIFLVIIVIYMFFMMRSKMIHRIYEIGVLREIGASKYKICRVFFTELLVLIFMTTMIGYFVSLILCYFANKKIGGLIGIFRYSPLYAIGGFLVLLVVSIVAGMLPILTLQRKTPAEIVAKYDL